MDFSKRSEVSEYLDDPNMDKELFRKAYLDINRCNALLGGSMITVKAIKQLIKKHPKASYTIYDMGCGDGYMLRKISDCFKNEAFRLELVGFDLREDIVSIANDTSIQYSDITYKRANILSLDKTEQCDILLCTLTMHHFQEKEISHFMEKFKELAKLGVVINDLERNKLSYNLFKLFSALFLRTTIARADGLISISKGFKKQDLLQLASKIKGVTHQIQWKWAFRYLWVMEPL